MNVYITLGSLAGSGLLLWMLKLLAEKYMRTVEDGISSIHQKFDSTIPGIQANLEGMRETFKYLDFRYAGKEELYKVQERIVKVETDLALVKSLLEEKLKEDEE